MGLKEKRFIQSITAAFLMISLFSACSSEQKVQQEKVLIFGKVRVKNYPDTPFVYSNSLKIENHLPKDENVRLTEELGNYWADSLLAPRVQKFGFFYNMKKPPVLDTGTITATKKLMTGYLFTQGYFDADVNVSVQGIDTFQKRNFTPQKRAFVAAAVHTGKQTVIDSLFYTLRDSSLIQLQQQYQKQSFIEAEKSPYSKQLIASELDRLVSVYRNHGYFLMHRENLIADVDTSDASLYELTLDPFELAEKIARAEERKKQNPVCAVNITQRRFIDTSLAKADSSFLTKFYNGKISYFPETILNGLSPDSMLLIKDEYKKALANDFSVYGKRGMFKPIIFKDYTYLKPDSLYSDENYYKTINNLNQIGAWRQIETKYEILNDTINFNFFLYPEPRYNWSINLEASRNTGDFLSSSNLFGASLNLGYKDRNFSKRAELLALNLNVGEEFSFEKGNSFLQSFQISPNATLSFPRVILAHGLMKGFDFGRTLLNLNFSYSQRNNFFLIRSIVGGGGWQLTNKNTLLQWRPINMEFYSVTKLPLLVDAIKENPFLSTSFLTGSLISTQLSITKTALGKKNPRNNNYFRFAVEFAYPLNLIHGLEDKFYGFLKPELELRHFIKRAKTDIAIRGFIGAGISYNNSSRFGQTLPFFKQYVAGGPNSMRAWGLRLLGQGSSLVSDTSSTFRDRYGDLQIEANFEYRYPIAHFSAVDIKGAFFADAGNIWNAVKDTNNPVGEFNIKRFYTWKDVGIGVGTGLRFDFSYFLVRIDFGIKLKDPARLENDGWLSIRNFTWLNKEYIRYDADGNLVSPKRTNYAVQLGIGLPF